MLNFYYSLSGVWLFSWQHFRLVVGANSFGFDWFIWFYRDRVYTIAFSPNGEYLASGSHDKSINIWSLNDGKIIKTYNGNGGIFEVCWNKEGDKIAACFSNNTVCVLDFRM
jgi:WD40 repeat protein